MTTDKNDSGLVKTDATESDLMISKSSRRPTQRLKSDGLPKVVKQSTTTVVENKMKVKKSMAHSVSIVNSSSSTKLKVKKVLKTSNVAKVHSSSVYATGRRKVALAKVWLWHADVGDVHHSVNGMPGLSYFSCSPAYTHRAVMPFSVVGTDIEQYSFRVDVCGGGKSAQSDALRHAFARAIVKLVPSLSVLLRSAKMLTRDSRMVQSKNTGKRKARKSEQYSKR